MNQARTIEELLKAAGKLEYSVFGYQGKPFNLNIWGERKTNMPGDNNNEFNDTLYVFYSEDGKTPILKRYEITTDPGTYWLQNPMNVKGTAAVVPGQYKKLWNIGLHQGKYKALVQTGKIKTYRDGNKDKVIDFKPESITEGYYGINCHRSNPYQPTQYVDKWSAGCQVFKNPKNFSEFLGLCEKASALYGNSFTYTLFTQEQLDTLGK